MKIAIVEDEIIIAKTIEVYLKNIGYQVLFIANSVEKAMDNLSTNKPDLLLLDIKLNGKATGIDLAQIINETYQIPFIFITANGDASTIEAAKKVLPLTFLLKPFTQNDLFTCIEIGMNNYQVAQQKKGDTFNYLLIKSGKKYTKINFENISMIESKHIYLEIHLANGNREKTRGTISGFLAKLPPMLFLQLSRSHIINHQQIEIIKEKSLIINGIELSIPTKKIKDELLSKLG